MSAYYYGATMAVLVRPDGTLHTLGHRNLVGRAAYCAVRLTDLRVSAEHASIYFDKGSWYLRDLASTNGTYVDGIKIELGRKNALALGATLGFGAPTPAWTFLRDDPPLMRLRQCEGQNIIEPVGELLVLPSEERPLLTIYQSQEGWFEEHDGEKRLLMDQCVVECENVRYFVEVPPAGAETAQTGLARVGWWTCFDELKLHFEVSRDRESLTLEILSGSDTRVVANRAYHELLLVLAEERLAAVLAGVPEPEQGWLNTDELCRRVAGDISKINVDVFRARQQFDQLGVVESHRIVERRPTSRQLRLGTRDVTIAYDRSPPNPFEPEI